jgi:integrase
MRERKPKHLQQYKDRHGKLRLYLRKPGQKRIALPGPIYSPAFWTAYHAAMEGAPVPTITNKNPPGSLSAAIVGYYGSAEYKSLAPSSQKDYRRILEHFRAAHGSKRLAKLETKHVNRIIDERAETPVAAMHLRSRLNSVMKWAIGDGQIRENPITASKKVSTRTDGYRTWTDQDVVAYRARWPEGTVQRLAMELLLFTGLRRSDVVRIGWPDEKGGAIHVTTQKSQHMTTLEIPIHPVLQRHIDLVPRDYATFLQTEQGEARSPNALTNWIGEAADEAGLPSDSSPHGLRKAACRMLAEAGCSAHMIQAITGHKHLTEVQTYTRAVEQRHLAELAIANLSNRTEWLDKLSENHLKEQGFTAVTSSPSERTTQITRRET